MTVGRASRARGLGHEVVEEVGMARCMPSKTPTTTKARTELRAERVDALDDVHRAGQRDRDACAGRPATKTLSRREPA